MFNQDFPVRSILIEGTGYFVYSTQIVFAPKLALGRRHVVDREQIRPAPDIEIHDEELSQTDESQL